MENQKPNEEFSRMQKLAGIDEIKVNNPNKVKNKYVVKVEELSDKDGDIYTIDINKALDYLEQFNDETVDAETFIHDDEGWGEFEQYLENIEKMTDEELEKEMREEMSYYFFNSPDEI